MICPKCGRENKDGNAFCMFCGNQFPQIPNQNMMYDQQNNQQTQMLFDGGNQYNNQNSQDRIVYERTNGNSNMNSMGAINNNTVRLNQESNNYSGSNQGGGMPSGGFVISQEPVKNTQDERKNSNNKNSKKGVIAVLTTIAVLLFCGVLAGAYFLFFYKPDSNSNPAPEVSSSPDVSTSPDVSPDPNPTVAVVPTDEPSPTPTEEPQGPVVINVWSYNSEIQSVIEEYSQAHPNSNVEFSYIIQSSYDDYYMRVQDALMGRMDGIDIFVVEPDYSYDYLYGTYSDCVLPYEDLGIDVDWEIQNSQIAQYEVDLGTNYQGKVVGLGYSSTVGFFIYNRDIAKRVFGTDDIYTVAPNIGSASNDWKYQFLDAAKLLKSKGYYIASDLNGVWRSMYGKAETPWVVNGKLVIDSAREEFLDIAKQLYSGNYISKSDPWTDAWYNDMNNNKVFGYFGPMWMAKYVISPNSNSNWGIVEAPSGFYWGHQMVMVNKALDDSKKEAVRDIIEWITLDCSTDGFQYLLANGYSQIDSGQTVVFSQKLMEGNGGSESTLSGQNIFEFCYWANIHTKGYLNCQYDSELSNAFYNEALRYAKGEISKKQALNNFRQYAANVYGIN